MVRLREWLSVRTRAGRLKTFVSRLDIKGGERIIDLGGVPEFWDGIATPLEITVINLPGFNPPYDGSSHHKITMIEGDACATGLPDQSFDIAFSNSVIEHVGGPENENRLAAEMHRLAPAYWVQTPSIWFPLEAHNHMPFWWFYPQFIKDIFLRSWRRRLPEWAEMIDGTVVISKARLIEMFPDGEIFVERVAGFVKSYSLYKRRQG